VDGDPGKMVLAMNAEVEKMADADIRYRNLFLGLAQEAADRKVI
jgi:hypothetical protein